MDSQEMAARAIDALTGLYVGQDIEANIIDLLTDLRHLCAFEGIDFDQCAFTSGIHFGSVEKIRY